MSLVPEARLSNCSSFPLHENRSVGLNLMDEFEANSRGTARDSLESKIKISI